MDDTLKKAAHVTLVDCLGLKKGDAAVVVTDPPTSEVGEALFYAAGNAGAEPLLAMMPTRKISGEEPPEAVTELMKSCNVLVLATKRSLSHTDSRRAATRGGVRAASMPGITAEIMARTMSADYREIAARTDRLIRRLEGAEQLYVTTPAGTDITLNVCGKEFDGDTGILTEPGSFGNLPAGEACTGLTLEGTTGTAVFDGSFADIGVLKNAVEVKFENGFAVKIEGGAEAAMLESALDGTGPAARQIAEIGIGTNDKARVTGVVLEDEKAMGTIHLALGNDVGFGGSNDVPLHLDGVIRTPTVKTDTDVTILDNGELVI
ncbi:MAG: aminopeptidase [Candidatus Coatesbacteria bacterium]|nr:MAG: aminopeptidase [Candidatus Coatesbacteria bacterium]